MSASEVIGLYAELGKLNTLSGRCSLLIFTFFLKAQACMHLSVCCYAFPFRALVAYDWLMSKSVNSLSLYEYFVPRFVAIQSRSLFQVMNISLIPA